MRKDSYDEEAWQEYIHKEDVTDLSRAKLGIIDQYMVSRENLPDRSITGGDLVEDPKTTAAIQADLAPMVDLAADDIIIYMTMHGFSLTTLEDGTVAWAMWRDMDFQV